MYLDTPLHVDVLYLCLFTLLLLYVNVHIYNYIHVYNYVLYITCFRDLCA